MATKTLRVTLADILGPTGPDGRVTGEVWAGFVDTDGAPRQVRYTDGTVVVMARARQQLNADGYVDFNVVPSDDATVHPDDRGFGVRVGWDLTVRGVDGQRLAVPNRARTVQVVTADSATVQFGAKAVYVPIIPGTSYPTGGDVAAAIGVETAARTAALATKADASALAAETVARNAALAGKANLSYVDGLVRSGATNTIVGDGAGTSIDPDATDGATAGGYQVVGLGPDVLAANVRGWKNTAVGHSAMRDNVDGYLNVAVGNSALERTTGGLGAGTPGDEDPGSRNTAVGSNALRYGTTGRGNVGVGRNAAHGNLTGNYNTAVGTNAYSGSVPTEGDANKTASYNTAVGYDAAFNTNADDNTAVGDHALYTNVSGTGHTAVGKNAARDTTALQATAVGYRALEAASTGNYNTAVGARAAVAVTTGATNTAAGTAALGSMTTGNGNTAVGVDAASAMATGDNNTAVGKNSLGGATARSNCTALGYQAAVTGDNQVQLGNASTTTYAYGAVQNRSDARDKADVVDTELGLAFIEALRPVQFRWDYREDYRDLVEDDDGTATVVEHEKDGSRKRTRHHQGLIAQEVEQVCADLGVDFGGLQHHQHAGGDDVYSIGYEELVAPLIKAVQQLSARVAELEAGRL